MLSMARNINPSRTPIREVVRRGDGVIVSRYSLVSTSYVDYEVWEPSQPMHAHSTITTIDGRWYGSLPTRPLPAAIEALCPGSQERQRAVRDFHDEIDAQAAALIRATFPHDFAES